MPGSRETPKRIWRWMRRLNRGVVAVYGRFGPPASLVLLLTTTGRKSGLPRVTPLQYEEVDGVYYVGSARGTRADWVRNLMAQPRVHVRLGDRSFPAVAEPILDRGRIAEFLALRLERRPLMIGLILRTEGLPAHPTLADLEALAGDKAVVALRPLGD